MNSPRRPLRVLTLGLISLALLGCAADDPIAVGVTRQTTTTVVGATDAEAELAVFPPVNPDVSRPKTIVDLRGQASVLIDIRGNAFNERFFRVDPGTEIVFENNGVNPHNVTASAEGAFETIPKEALEESRQALILDAEGDYPFFCSLHGTETRGQTGYVIVGDG